MPKNSPRKPLDSRLKQILQEMDPSWSGETPELAKPIRLSPGGLERLRAALSPAPDPEAAYGRMANAALRLFYLISRKWGLTEEDQNAILGVEENQSLEALGKKGWGSFDLEALECFSHILGIYGNLHTLFPSGSQADAWIKKPNSAPLFKGRTALQVMKEGVVGLRSVRSYLQAEVIGMPKPRHPQ